MGGRARLYVRSFAATLGSAGALVAAAPAAAATGEFVEFKSSPLSVTAPRAVLATDVDGDADRDLAVLSSSTSDITILKNNGSARFKPANSGPIDVGPGFPNSIDVGDVNGDGRPDLAVTNTTSATVTVLKSKGGGRFAAAGAYPTGPYPADVSIGDLNGDHAADIAVALGPINGDPGGVTLLKNNGSGRFSEFAVSPLSTGGNKPVSVLVKDLDGDGFGDLGVSNQQSHTVSVMLNNGSAHFANAPGSPVSSGGSFPQDLDSGDLDHDGDPDLVVPNSGTDNVSVLTNNGDGGFAFTGGAVVGDDPLFAVAANLDSQPADDVVVSNSLPDATDKYTVNVLLNNGSGGLFEGPHSPYEVGTTPEGLAAADLDGDGDRDLAVSYVNNFGGVTLLRNR